NGPLATGCAVSADGLRFSVRTKREELLWDRVKAESLVEALARSPRLRMAAPKAESVAFRSDGRGLYAIPEGSQPPVMAFDLPD
ncbi:MAG: hypothetical protein JWM25_1745, partial [Thermoleophilia bacterium]|nr:hypothetical protein [Thermoleophilia bacterium]